MEAFFNKLQKVGVAMIFGGVVLSRFVFVVDGGERALKYDKVRGGQEKIYGEGMHFYIPIVQVSIGESSLIRNQGSSRSGLVLS